ncbi:MAG: FAD-dependent oxidoreductase [Pseudomonadota bacterium]
MFAKLFESGKIGKMEVPNRIIMAPMLTCLTDGDYVSDRLIHFLAERAKGGVGLIITEVASVHPLGRMEPNELSVYDDKFLPGLQRLADEIHVHGAKIAMQIGHGGSQCREKVLGEQPVAPSPVPSFRGEVPRELSIEEIKGLVEDYVKAAARAKKAGFDGVELHCAHGYLGRQFLSPLTNKRTDQYGGSIEGRTRFACDIIRGSRQELGDYPVWVRINGDEYIEGGQTLEDSRIISGLLEAAGADAVSVSAGCSERAHWSVQPMSLPPGCLLHLSAGVKAAVSIPVIAAGRMNTPELAEKAIKEGKADFIAMGRAMIADPEFPKKAKAGRSSDIRRCVADNECIDNVIFKGLACTVNAFAGREGEYKIQPTKKSKKVLVAGGGPAGMEAARVLAIRGHKVTLCEKSDGLGGQLNIAVKSPFKEGLSQITEFLCGQITKLGVRVEFNREVTPSLVEEMSPDVIVLANGARPQIPSILGVNQDNVVSGQDVLSGKSGTGEKVVVIGGGRVGIEVAEFLGEKGRKVTIVEKLKRIGIDLGITMLISTMERISKYGIEMLPRTEVEEIKKGSVVVVREGKRTAIETDTVVLAVGAEPDRELHEALSAGPITTYRIGDCVEPRNIQEAIADAVKVALKI